MIDSNLLSFKLLSWPFEDLLYWSFPKFQYFPSFPKFQYFPEFHVLLCGIKCTPDQFTAVNVNMIYILNYNQSECETVKLSTLHCIVQDATLGGSLKVIGKEVKFGGEAPLHALPLIRSLTRL